MRRLRFPPSLVTRALLFAAFLTVEKAGAEVRCAGKPVGRIVLGTRATEVELFAAHELQSYLGEMSTTTEAGAAPLLPIVQSDEPAASSGADIVLGQNATNPWLARLSATAEVKADAATLGEDGYLIQRTGSALLLTGTNPRSSLFAVYHLLESCGARFFGYRARGGEIVPRREIVEIPDVTVVEKPVMKYRFVSDNNFSGSDREKVVAVADWAAKNRCNVFTLAPSRVGESWEQIAVDEVRKRGLLIAGPGHVLSQFTPNPALFATHPEYFPLRDGQRVARVSAAWGGVPSFCASNPDAMQLVVAQATAYLGRHPFIDLFAIYPPDGSQHGAQCQCAACARQSASDWYLDFINRVAQELASKRPSAKIMWIAYNEFGVPPKVVRPVNGGQNLVLLWCNDLRNFQAPMDSEANRRPAPYLAWKLRLKSIKTDWMKNPGDQDLAAWNRWKAWSGFLHASAYRGDVVLLEYYNAHVADSLRVPALGFCQSGPWPPGAMPRDFQFYRGEGITGWQNCTDYYNDTPNPYWNWLAAQLLWNPEADLAGLDTDFYARLYGAAAADMQRYFTGLWSAISQVEKFSDLRPRLAELDPLLRHAEATVLPGDLAARVKAARTFHTHCADRARQPDSPP